MSRQSKVLFLWGASKRASLTFQIYLLPFRLIKTKGGENEMAEKTAKINGISAKVGEIIISLNINGKPFSKISLLTERKKS